MRQSDLWPYWNHNVVRHPDVLRSVPNECGDALDVGCGDGLLARKLTARAKRVTGIDSSPEMISRARTLTAGYPELTFVGGDFLTADLPDEGFDFVCSVTTIHHMDFEGALVRMRGLLRPGGRLVVVGLARETGPAEWAATIAIAPFTWTFTAVCRASDPAGMPTAEPTMSYASVRATARRLLPGVRYRRYLLFRYSLTWDKPPAWSRGASTSGPTHGWGSVEPRLTRTGEGR